MQPTSSQAHLALAVLRDKATDLHGANVHEQAAALVLRCFREPSWTGSAEGCAPFGAIAEESAATIMNLQSSLQNAQAVVGALQEGIRDALDASALGPAQQVLSRALEAAEALAAGLPVPGSNPETSAGAGQGADLAKSPGNGPSGAVQGAQL